MSVAVSGTITVEAGGFRLLPIVQAASGARPVSCSLGTEGGGGGCFLWGKAARA
jgi:hypothetical protein